MKINKLTLKAGALILSIVLAVSSCSKEGQHSDNSYYVSKELLVSYSKNYINTFIDGVSGSIAEVATLKPLVVSDVNIYRMVYKTTINGNSVDVSGLVCVPVTPGTYPVLSFQNGTNTVNAYCPSEFPINYPYQSVEILASMGYIVVIADYPGFGESSQLPHPYLVSEPTTKSLVNMLYAVRELTDSDLPDITLKNEYYLLGYSQGGWATLALHKALEQDYSDDFNLAGSACGAGPYNIYQLLQGMTDISTYPMPVYLGYILNAYIAYNQFTNPATDIFNEPYASKISSLYTGLLSADEINSQLTTSIADLLTADFRSGLTTSPKYSSVREALNSNSITGWHTYKPLLLIHGGDDATVNPVSTENMYSSMIEAGTSPDICEKVIIPGLDHSDGVAPCMIQGILFLMGLNSSI